MPAPLYDSRSPLKDTTTPIIEGLFRPSQYRESPLSSSSIATAVVPREGFTPAVHVQSVESDTVFHHCSESSTLKGHLHGLLSSSSSPSLSPQNYETKNTFVEKEPRYLPFPRLWKHRSAGPVHTFTIPVSDIFYRTRNSGAHDGQPLLPLSISPADSTIERPSTPHSARGLFAEDRERISTAPRLVGKSVHRPVLFESKGHQYDCFTDHSRCLPRKSEVQAADYGDIENDEMDEPKSISAVMACESDYRSRKGSQLLGLFKENNKAFEARGCENQHLEERERAKEKEWLGKRRTKERDENASDRETAAEGIVNVVAPLQVAPAEGNKESNLCSDFVSVSRTKDERFLQSSRDVRSIEAVPGDPSSSRSVVPTISRAPTFLLVRGTDSPNLVDEKPKPIIRTACEGLADSGYHEGDEYSRLLELQPEFSASPYTSNVVDRRLWKNTTKNKVSQSDHSVSDHSPSDLTASYHDGEYGEDEISSTVYFPHTTPTLARISTPKIPSTATATSLTTTKTISKISGRKQDGFSEQFQRRRSDSTETVYNRSRVYSHHPNSSTVDLSAFNSDDQVLYHGQRRISFSEDETCGFASVAPSTVSRFSDISDFDESSTDDIERSVIEDTDIDVTPTQQTKNLPCPVHEANKVSAAPPLGAVELKPYKHQVGGHTALFRFSKKAVCKSLSNRENEFYEAVETRHPELLKFLPRYVKEAY